MTSREYENKMDNLSFQITQLVLEHCSRSFGFELTDFTQCRGIIESELKNPILNALDYYLNETD